MLWIHREFLQTRVRNLIMVLRLDYFHQNNDDLLYWFKPGVLMNPLQLSSLSNSILLPLILELVSHLKIGQSDRLASFLAR